MQHQKEQLTTFIRDLEKEIRTGLFTWRCLVATCFAVACCDGATHYRPFCCPLLPLTATLFAGRCWLWWSLSSLLLAALPTTALLVGRCYHSPPTPLLVTAGFLPVVSGS
ncbi:hypothetical protein RIF29_20618 [Crotalaria pallida]|uniref:Transmembrane protein n=1 Tax=Crotalaria pallida TaxID=3830 RepID=A0AAN9I6I0_CROPI